MPWKHGLYQLLSQGLLRGRGKAGFKEYEVYHGLQMHPAKGRNRCEVKTLLFVFWK